MAKRKTPQTSSLPDDPATRYARRVVNGDVIAGPYVRAACQRHLDDLKDGHKRGLTWNQPDRDGNTPVERVIAYFEQILTVEREYKDEFGETASEAVPFRVHESQAFILGSLFGWKNADGNRRFRRAYIEQAKGSGKALAVDTPIPTPDGWKTMGGLKPGDRVFDDAGKPCIVTAVSGVMLNRPCYRLVFSDGAEIVADAEHLWNTSALRSGRKPGPNNDGRPYKGCSGLRTTAEIAASVTLQSESKHPQAKYNHRVDIAGPLDCPDADLPIAPYTLGAWLGDGDSDSARITCAYDDWEVIDRIQQDGYTVKEQKKHSDTTARVIIGSGGRSQAERNICLQSKLRSEGLLRNKHIPDRYFRASYRQRLELLQGLLDTDGSALKDGACEFTACNYRLAADTQHLVRTLGFKPMMKESAATLNGREVGRRWRLRFHAYKSQPIYSLKRKLERLKDRPKTRSLSLGRMIVSCEPVDSVPVQCISVDSQSSMFLAGEHYVPTHNSPLAAGIGHYMLTATKKLRAEVYSAATDKDQAAILFRDAVEMWRRSPHLHNRLHPSGQNPVWQLTHINSASFFKPISSEKKGKSGIRPYCALIDEVHEHSDNSVIEMLRAGTKGNQQALIFEITNSGSDRTSVCWNEHEYSVKVATGEAQNDAWFSYVCALDEDKDDPFEDESCWIKTNPLLGVSIYPDFIREQVNEAKGMPSKEALVRRLHFCQWTEGDEGWISRDIWEKCEAELKLEDYAGEPCYGGLDLAYTRDLSAFALVFPADETLDAFVWFWKPKDGLQKAVKEDRVPYDLWVKNGHLYTTDGNVIKLGPIGQKMADINDNHMLQVVAYDNYRHRELADDLLDMGIELPMTEHPQGFRRTPDNPLWMPNSVQQLENAIAEGKLRVQINPVLRWNVGSVIVRPDPAGTDNKIFDKRKSRARIDGIVALAMAVGAAKQNIKPVYPVSLEDILE